MIESVITVSLLIVTILLIRSLFKKKVSAKLIYALWLAVVIKLCIPFSFISVDMPFPEMPSLDTLLFEAENPAVKDATPAMPQTAPIHSSYDSFTELSAPVDPPPTENKEVALPIIEDTENISQSPSPSYDIKEIIFSAMVAGSVIALIFFGTSFGIMTAKLLKSRRYHSTIGKTKVYVSDKIPSPCVMGIVPVVYITPYAEECKDLSLIIRHEKTHIRHGDHLWAVIRILFIILLWWNPLIWIAAILSKRDAELACDESVVSSMDESEKRTYTRLIIDMIPQKGGFVVAFNNAPIKYRLLRLTGIYKTKLIAAVITTVTVIFACVFAFVSNGVNEEDSNLAQSGEDIHMHKFEEATCVDAARCECSLTEGDALGHNWLEATCTSPKTCSRCSLTEGIPLEHTWQDATCDSAMTCSVCKSTMGEHLEHIRVEATCTSPSYCSLCHETEGSTLGHSFADATCTSAKTCTRCSYSEGNPLGHIWSDATCTTVKTCTRCQATDGSPLGHKFSFESCTVCGAENIVFKQKIQDAKDILSFAAHGISYSKYTQKLTDYGYTQDEIDYIIKVISPDWNKQADTCVSFFLTYNYYYTKEDAYNYLIKCGFEHEIAYEKTKNLKGRKNPWADSYDISPNKISTSNMFGSLGNYNYGDPIKIFP